MLISRIFSVTLAALLLAVLTLSSSTLVFAAPQQPYNETLALQLLHLSSAAYCPQASLKDWSCPVCGAEASFQPLGSVHNSVKDVQSLVGYDPSSDHVVLSFRGTSSIVDWLNNFDLVQVPAEGICAGCGVHLGFLGDYNSLREDTLELVKVAMKAHPNSGLAITGHSLGGALASIAAVDLALNANLTASLLYTFGSPRATNQIFANTFSDLASSSGLTSYRVTHAIDPVPHVPWTSAVAGIYVHLPQEVYYPPFSDTPRLCDARGEDPACASQHPLAVVVFGVPDHLIYLGRATTCGAH